MSLITLGSNLIKLIRLDKPIGIILLLWPTLWALCIAGEGSPALPVVIVFIVGVFLMRSVGCIINDIADIDFDARVARTKGRPLVNVDKSKKISVTQACILAISLSLVAFLLLLTLQNSKLIGHAFMALFLASIYPLCKRFIACPQFALGLAFGYSIPMAFVALNKELGLITWLLYSTNIFLTIVYDSFYAMADKQDDLKIGIKSSVIWFGRYDLIIIGMLQCAVLLHLVILSELLNFKNFYYCISLVLLLFIYQIQLASGRQPDKCLKAFKNNGLVGLVIFLGFFLEYM